MTMALRPIETRYKGYRFRSRLEARWAVFFGALGLKWEYEPEGFVTSVGHYLPDFRVWTPQGKPTWYEVKPAHVKSDGKLTAFTEHLLAEWVSRSDAERIGESLTRVSLLSGDPVDALTEKTATLCPRCGHIKLGAPQKAYEVIQSTEINRQGTRMHLLRCSSCFLETQHLEAHETTSPRLLDLTRAHGSGVLGVAYGMSNGWVAWATVLPRRVMECAYAARAARFEHGESV